MGGKPTVKERLEAAGVELFTVKSQATHGGVAHYQGYAPLDVLKAIFGRPRGAVDGYYRWHEDGKTYVYHIPTNQISFRK